MSVQFTVVSMVAEEIGLTNYLRKQNREILETDIGEYIVDVEGQGPSQEEKSAPKGIEDQKDGVD